MVNQNELINSVRTGLDKTIEKEMEIRKRIEGYASYSGERYKKQLAAARENLDAVVEQRNKYQAMLDKIVGAVIKDI